MNVKKASQMKTVTVPSNPFATQHLSKIPFRFEQGDWNSNLLRLREMGYRAAVVGQRGSGKSTLLVELENRIREQSKLTTFRLEIPHNRSEQGESIDEGIAMAERGRVLLVDGLERVSLRQKFRLFRALGGKGGLVVTATYPMRLPPFALPTWVRTTTSELLLDYILSELKMASPDVRAAGQQSFEQNRGNIRRVLEELHDRHSAMRFK